MSGTIQTPFGTKMAPLDEGQKRGWSLNVDGNEVPVKSQAVLANEKVGFQVVYAKGPAGYDQVAFHERGGGGSVTLLFTIWNGRLFVAIVKEPRPLQSDQPVLNAVRGFLDPGKDHFEQAKTELEEEMGLSKVSIFELPGDGGNPNSTFFETWPQGEGIRFWGAYIPDKLLVAIDKGFAFKEGVLKPAKDDKLAEKILGSLFLPWEEAAKLGDMMTMSAIARLLAYLHLREEGAELWFHPFFLRVDPELLPLIERHETPILKRILALPERILKGLAAVAELFSED